MITYLETIRYRMDSNVLKQNQRDTKGYKYLLGLDSKFRETSFVFSCGLCIIEDPELSNPSSVVMWGIHRRRHSGGGLNCDQGHICCVSKKWNEPHKNKMFDHLIYLDLISHHFWTWFLWWYPQLNGYQEQSPTTLSGLKLSSSWLAARASH